MQKLQLNQELLDNRSFWDNKNVILPQFDRKSLPVRSLSFSAGRMAYGHTGDILQDILNDDPSAGAMAGIETYACKYCEELAKADYLQTQLIFENEKGKGKAKIQGAVKKVLFIDSDQKSKTWQEMMAMAHDPGVQWATINAPEGVYGVSYSDGDYAAPANPKLISDMENGTTETDPAKWTAFACERFKAGHPFALVSCTNFSGNGHYTRATVRTVAKAWEERGFAPEGFEQYIADPQRFSFPNTMIDRIAVAPEERALKIMDQLGIESNLIVTEECRYWAVEDLFPAGRPAFENAEGVFMCPDYNDVKRYEDMKLRILNMSHSLIAGLGILLGYRGTYGIYRAMQDKDITTLIDRIIKIVLQTVVRPQQMEPADFARDTIARLNNPNIPDDPMRIAFNGSTKMKPRFLDTYFAGLQKGIGADSLDVVLLPVAGFLRYTLGIDDAGGRYDLENDPLKDLLLQCGGAAKLGEPESVAAFKSCIEHADMMGTDLYGQGDAGKRLEKMTAAMLAQPGAVRATMQRILAAN